MSPNQKTLREVRDQRSKNRQRLGELAAITDLSDDQRSELDSIEKSMPDLERRERAAVSACESEDQSTIVSEGAADPETRARLELRSRARVGPYLAAHLSGKHVQGAELELAQAAGVSAGEIPIELWERPEQREQRDVTPAPGTTGVNLDTLRPMIFAPSIHTDLMIDMPNVMSGTYASGTITTAATAAAKNKGEAVPDTAAAFSVETATPRRIGGALDLAVEDIAAVGSENFESILREHISMVLSAELDDQIINGDGNAPNVNGLLNQLTPPAAPAAGVTTYDRMLAVAAGGIDGLWATEIGQIGIVAGVDTYVLSLKNYRDIASAHLGEQSFAQFARDNLSFFRTNSRMPAKASHIQDGILCRKGRAGMRTAVLPTWGSISIDDIYTGSKSGQRSFTVSTLVGSRVILVQPNAYAQVKFRVST